nr:hypothetical protein JVH1_8451 [Rhodococcus sp. JVH1]
MTTIIGALPGGRPHGRQGRLVCSQVGCQLGVETDRARP